MRATSNALCWIRRLLIALIMFNGLIAADLLRSDSRREPDVRTTGLRVTPGRKIRVSTMLTSRARSHYSRFSSSPYTRPPLEHLRVNVWDHDTIDRKSVV